MSSYYACSYLRGRRMTGIPAELAQSMLNVLNAIQARPGSKMPSRDVQLAAAQIPADAITHSIHPTQTSHVVGSRGIRYAQILYYRDTTYAEIIDAECTCDAGRARTMCRHLLRVLAEANRSGQALKF